MTKNLHLFLVFVLSLSCALDATQELKYSELHAMPIGSRGPAQDCATEKPCQQVNLLVSSLSQSVTGWCAQLSQELDEVKTLISTTNPCIQATPISAPLVITEPGAYCLTTDLSTNNASVATIVIDADDVTLNLNGHSVTSLAGRGISAINHTNITISNGYLKDCLSDGVFIQNCSLVNCELLEGENNQNTIHFDNCVSSSISRCVAKSNRIYGIFVENSTLLRLEKNRMYRNNVSGILMTNSSNSNVFQNNSHNNGLAGIEAGLSTDIILEKNYVKENGSFGFRVFNSLKCLIKNNVSELHDIQAFKLSRTDHSLIENNIALSGPLLISYGFYNASGFNNVYKNNFAAGLAYGFVVETFPNNLLESNIAINNRRGGYYCDVANNVFQGNYAAGNTINYVAAGSAVLPFIVYDLSSGQFKNPTNCTIPINPLTQDNISVQATC